MQGVVIPFAQTSILYLALARFAPQWQGRLELGPAAAFLLNFAGVDYLYYWNHRFLHSRLCRWHAVHHTAEDLDVWIT